MKEFEAVLKKNLTKLKKFLRTGQIVPSSVVRVLNDREVIVKIKGLPIKAYTNIPFNEGDQVYLYIQEAKDQVRFKILSEDQYKRLTAGGIDYTI